VLTRLGHRVVAVAGDGKQLVERCRETHPDLVITDIKMPHLSGLDAMSQINRDAEVPAVLVSATRKRSCWPSRGAGRVTS
jgi:YesN/AraC family two-component response regulator